MRRIFTLFCLIALIGTASAASIEKKAKAAPAARAPAKEQFTCRSGPNDKQARLTVVVVKGRPMEFAYYSRLGTRVCSIAGWRGDPYNKWDDVSGQAHVKLLEGAAEFDYQPGHLKVTFSEVPRMRYCGMDGELNGAVEVSLKQSECGLAGVFD